MFHWICQLFILFMLVGVEFPLSILQSQKTQGFCVADFATLSDEKRSHSKILLLFMWIKEPCARKFQGLARSKLLGISQTNLLLYPRML